MPTPFDLKLSSGTLRAHRFGAEADRLTLCIHGLSANSRSFDFIAERLASPTSTVVAIDLRGRGWSDITPAGTYGWANHAQDVIDTADALGAPTFDYIGHSMGAFIGLELARIAPQRIRKLALIDAIGVPEAAALLTISASIQRLGTKFPDADAYVAAMRGMGHIEDWNEYWETYYRYELVPSPDGGVTPRTDRAAVFEDAMYGSTQRPNSYWPGITMDTLLVRAARPLGAGFIVTAPDRDQFLASVARSSAVDIDSNHYGIITHEATAESVRRFLGPT
jgi:pimeloyl-ACP methyl ester carboxylesterase